MENNEIETLEPETNTVPQEPVMIQQNVDIPTSNPEIPINQPGLGQEGGNGIGSNQPVNMVEQPTMQPTTPTINIGNNQPPLEGIGQPSPMKEDIQNITPPIEATPQPMNGDSNITPPTSNNQVANQNSNTKKLLGIFGIIAIIGIFGLIIVPKFMTNGKKIVQKEVTTFFAQAKKIITKSESSILEYDLEKDSLGLEGTLVIDSNYKSDGIDLAKLKNYKLVYGGVIDKNNNNASANLQLVKDSSKLIDINGYVNGKDASLSLGDIYDRTITEKLEKEIKELDFSKNKNVKDLETLIDKTEKIVKETIKEKDITKSKVEKEIGGKTDKYTKIEYKINVEEFTREVFIAYQKDNEIIKLISNLTEQEEKYVKELLEESIKELEEDREQSIIKLNVYLKGISNEMVMTEIIPEEEGSALTIEKENNTYKYQLTADNKEVFSGEYDIEKELFTMNNKEDGMTLKISKENNQRVIDLKYENEYESMTINATIQNKITSTTQQNDTVIKLAVKAEEESLEATITNQLTLEKNKKVVPITSNNPIEMDAVSEEEIEAIYSRIEQKLSSLINDIMPAYSEEAMTSFRKIM